MMLVGMRWPALAVVLLVPALGCSLIGMRRVPESYDARAGGPPDCTDSKTLPVLDGFGAALFGGIALVGIPVALAQQPTGCAFQGSCGSGGDTRAFLLAFSIASAVVTPLLIGSASHGLRKADQCAAVQAGTWLAPTTSP